MLLFFTGKFTRKCKGRNANICNRPNVYGKPLSGNEIQLYTRVQMASEQMLATATLPKRSIRPADHREHNDALMRLARIMAEAPEKVPGEVTREALQLCSAGSAGISVLEQQGESELFRLRNVAGRWAMFEGGTMPRDESPCGACLKRGTPLLYKNPASIFGCLQDLAPKVRQSLVVPIRIQGRPVGTLWVVAHDAGRPFDSEDLRVMSSLADLSATAFKLLSVAGQDHVSAEEAGNRLHIQQLRSSCRAALNHYVDHARATCELAGSYPLSLEELEELKERREEEHNAYWKYMDVRQDLLSILILDSERSPDRFKG